MGLGKGVIFAIVACLLWSQVFVLPLIFDDIPVLWLTWGRCTMYASVSILIIATQFQRMRKLFSWPLIKHLLMLALVANILHYVALVMGLRYADPALATMILSVNPITVSLYSNLQDKSFPLYKLIMPISAIGIGLLLLYSPLLKGQHSNYELFMSSFFGILALGTWTWFIVHNHRLFKQHANINAQDWVSFLGLATGVWVLILTTIYCLWTGNVFIKQLWETDTSFVAWLGVSVVLGVGSSWLANYLWVQASQRLSLTLGGLLTVLEALFSLIFIYAWQRSIPLLMDLMGAASIFLGVCLAIYLLRQNEKKTSLEFN